MDVLAPVVFTTFFSSLLLFLINLFLYREYKQKSVQLWTISWGFYTVRFVFELLAVLVPHRAWPVFLNLSVLTSGYFLLKGTFLYLKPAERLSRGWAVFVGLAAVAVVIDGFLKAFPFAVTLITFSFLGFSNLLISWLICRSKDIPLRERLFLGVVFLIWGLHKLDYPFLRPFPWFSVWGYTLGSLLGIATGIGLLILFLKLEKKKAEESESRLKALVDSLDDVVFTLSPDGRFTSLLGKWVSRLKKPPHAYLGYTAIDILGKEVGSVHTEKALQVARENRTIIYESEVTFHEGQRILQFILSPVRDGAGGCREIVGVGRDITVFRRTLDELRNRVEEKTLLLREIQHRVQNNLQVIISLLNLQSHGADSERERRSFQVAISRIHALSDIYCQLQGSENVSHIRMDWFLGTLLARVLSSAEGEERPCFSVKSDEIVLPLDKAITVGLILNEVLYGFQESYRKGNVEKNIHVALSDEGRALRCLITYGKKPALKEDPSSVWMSDTVRRDLIQSLVAHLGGRIEYQDHSLGLFLPV